MYCFDFDVHDWIHYEYNSTILCDSCDPIIMYCLGLFVVFYSEKCCLQTKVYDVAHPVMNIHIPIYKFHSFICFTFWVTSLQSEKQNTPYHNPIYTSMMLGTTNRGKAIYKRPCYLHFLCNICKFKRDITAESVTVLIYKTQNTTPDGIDIAVSINRLWNV